MVLEPGDPIDAGAPPYLSAGDVVELEVDGLDRPREVRRQA
jgi:hypothetical protein